jgi:hypothetical protein
MLNFKKIYKLILFYMALSASGILWIRWGNLDARFIGEGGTRGILFAICVGFTVFALSNMVTQKFEWAQKLERLFQEILTPMSLPTIFAISFFSAVGEEIFFRGAVQNQFGYIAASLLFGLVHFPVQKIMIPWTIAATVMGFVLGGLYLYAGNLLAPITLHFIINGMNLWAIDQKSRQTN